jgi:molybdate transport system substrate-binding protein
LTVRRAVLLLVLAVGACATSGAQAAARAESTVYAAASLTNVFPRIDPAPRYSFGGSNTLAAQIRLGAPADVFASADMTLPNGLYEDGLCSKPVVFARNRVVVVVPRSNPARVRSIFGLTRPGVKIVIAGPTVPVGAYTHQILRKLNLSVAVLKNVVSVESDVRGVLAKVALGEADAGFVYATDAKTAPGRVTVINVPAWAQPSIRYGICVVSSSGHKPEGRAFVAKVLSRAGQAKLLAAGFLPRVMPG